MGGKPARILVIDDDHKYLELAREVLEGAGYEVETADTWLGAIRVLPTLPDLALVDLHMASMQGDKLSQILKKNHPTMKVCLVSSDDVAVIKGLSDKLKLDGYISKSFPPNTALRRVSRILEGKKD